MWLPKEKEDKQELQYTVNSITSAGYFTPRTTELENDPTQTQIIPYCIFQYEDKYFTYRRLPKSTESRLTGKLSIGVGGHINNSGIITEKATGPTKPNYLANGLTRELLEETNIGSLQDSVLSLGITGLIYNTSTPVDSVHIGVVCKLELHKNHELLCMSEPGVVETVGWFTKEELQNIELESWSSLIVKKL